MLTEFVTVRSLLVAGGLMFALLSTEASALFIVNQPWLLPARAGRSTEVYMNLTSTDGATLVAVRTDAAADVFIRGPVKGASALEKLPLPAGSVVALAPGKNHIALVKLNRSVKLGERVGLTLTIEGADGARREIEVQAEARKRSPVDDERLHHSHAH